VLEGLQRHSDSRGRRLADLFYRLPTPEDLPEYYRLIPKPVDLAGINSRLLGGEYATSGDLVGRCKLTPMLKALVFSAWNSNAKSSYRCCFHFQLAPL